MGARICSLCLVLAPVAALAVGPGPRVVVLKSADREAYASVVAGFSSEVNGRVAEVTLLEGGEAAQRANARLLQRLSQEPPAMVLAIGPTAANAAESALTNVPLVFGMVP